jgi:hypothetical protein
VRQDEDSQSRDVRKPRLRFTLDHAGLTVTRKADTACAWITDGKHAERHNAAASFCLAFCTHPILLFTVATFRSRATTLRKPARKGTGEHALRLGARHIAHATRTVRVLMLTLFVRTDTSVCACNEALKLCPKMAHAHTGFRPRAK